MKKSTRKKLSFAFISLFLLGVVCVCATYYLVLYPKFDIKNKQYIYVSQKDDVNTLLEKIGNVGGKEVAFSFEVLSKVYDLKNNLRLGRYAISPGEKAKDVFRKIKNGNQTPMYLTINSSREISKLSKSIAKQIMITEEEIYSAITNYKGTKDLPLTDFNPFAFFIPDTYEVYWNISGEQLMERMQAEYHKFWNKDRTDKAKEIGMTPLEVMTLASIVDEETLKEDEKPMVAGLYINRLQKNMLLQADPTVKFALQDFALRRITNQHLTVDSPYNTYINKGLPPGPIRIPSKSGIDAVLNYAKHDYIYMCAKEDFSGRHNFATTYGEHMANARRYWAELNKRKIFK